MSGVFGPPIPDEILLIILGYWSFEGTLGFFASLGLVIAGSLGVTMLNYLVGRFCLYSGRWFKLPNSPRLAAKMEKAQGLVKRCGPGIVLGCYFLPGLRHWVPVVAGLLKAPPGLFAGAAGLGAILWGTVYLALGYFLAKHGVTLPTSADAPLFLVIPGVALLFLAVWLAWKKLEGEKSAAVSPRI
ncbi:MAG: DedA family protein [Syntrophales bacterium]|nr:DedA family protein [Syntrophales bacterium]